MNFKTLTDTDIAAFRASGPHKDGEVLGLDFFSEKDLDLHVIQWQVEPDDNGSHVYMSGETIYDFGIHNLREAEAERCGVTEAELRVAVEFHAIHGYGITEEEMTGLASQAPAP